MKNWIRVTSVAFVLIGGTAFFGHWSLNQLNNALNNLSAANIAIANTPPISSADKRNMEQISTTTPEITSTTTPETVSTSATSTDSKLSLIFPKKSNEFYIGCTYQISLQSSSTIRSLGTALVDAGTGETSGPIASGLARINKIEPNSQSLDWKVGEVWPGEYYIKVSNINGAETETKSKYFMIRKMPEDISASKRENICKGSGGSF